MKHKYYLREATKIVKFLKATGWYIESKKNGSITFNKRRDVCILKQYGDTFVLSPLSWFQHGIRMHEQHEIFIQDPSRTFLIAQNVS